LDRAIDVRRVIGVKLRRRPASLAQQYLSTLPRDLEKRPTITSGRSRAGSQWLSLSLLCLFFRVADDVHVKVTRLSDQPPGNRRVKHMAQQGRARAPYDDPAETFFVGEIE